MLDHSFYDLQSLAFSTVTVSVVTLLCLGPAAWAFPREYQTALRSWILGTAAMVLSGVLFVTSQDQPASAVLLPVLVGVGVAEWRHAIRKFGGTRAREAWPYVVIGAGTLITVLGGGEYVISSLVSSTCLAVLHLAAAAAAARLTIPARGATRHLLVIVLVAVLS